jgi:hypothetical protein
MKFGYDSRIAHLSCLILSKQLTRDEAIAELAVNAYNDFQKKDDAEYVRKKLNLSETEFEQILALPAKTFRDYPSEFWILKFKNRFKSLMGRLGINLKGK